MHAPLRRRQILMARELLNRARRCAPHRQVRTERMTKDMHAGVRHLVTCPFQSDRCTHSCRFRRFTSPHSNAIISPHRSPASPLTAPRELCLDSDRGESPVVRYWAAASSRSLFVLVRASVFNLSRGIGAQFATV